MNTNRHEFKNNELFKDFRMLFRINFKLQTFETRMEKGYIHRR
jgi:hypothetical protein